MARLIALQFIIALSFGLRFALTKHWPLTSGEVTSFETWLPEFTWSKALLLRWSSLVVMSAFLVFWAQLLQKKDRGLALTPLFVMHLLPDFVLMGFVSSLWPVLCFVIVTALWLQKKNTTFWSIAYPIIGIFAFSFWEGSALLCLPPFLMVALQKYWKTQHAWKVVLPTTALIMVVCIERATSPTHLMPLINPWLSEFPLIIGLLMVGGWINGFKAEVSVPESWIWGTLPIVAFGVGGSPLPPALVVIALFYVLSILHVQWWEHLSAKHNFSLCLALSCLVFHPSSQTVRGLRQRLEHDSEQQLLALEAKRYLEGEHQLVLCSIPTLAPLLRVSLAPSPVLVYPNAHLNTSHLHIGKKGVWIHDGQQSANHHLHLENARLWKKLDHRTEIQHSTLIDRFDRLLYPF